MSQWDSSPFPSGLQEPVGPFLYSAVFYPSTTPSGSSASQSTGSLRARARSSHAQKQRFGTSAAQYPAFRAISYRAGGNEIP